MEQGALIWLSFKADNLEELSLIVSIFAIIVLTTFALHKLLMESRIKVLEHELSGVMEEKEGLELQTTNIRERCNKLVQDYKDFVSKDLYKSGTRKGIKNDKRRI